MTPKQSCAGESRRQFIKKTGTVAAALAGAGFLNLPAMAGEAKGAISIVLDAEDKLMQEAPVNWAVDQLRYALAWHGLTTQMYTNVRETPPAQECIAVGRSASSKLGDGVRAEAEAFAFQRENVGTRPVLWVDVSDARGAVYGLLELADRILFTDDVHAALKAVPPVYERPANAIRSVARAFVSDVEDKAWFQDRSFWLNYLTMLATQRFNRFHLMLGVGYDFTTNITDCYFHFAYPFLLDVLGYNVRAVPLPDAERDANLEMLKFISDEAARRGLHFQLGVWTHAYQWTNSPKANYVIQGLTPETQGAYCRDALCAVLKACPNIRGVTIRTHGESGVAEGNYDLWKTIFDGVAKCGRPVEIDLHAKGVDQAMIDVALGTEMKVNISPKFWAEHMGLPYMQGAIRPQEMPPRNARDTGFFSRSSGSRSFLRYGYGDLLAEDRRHGVLHRVWPGTQRLLAWADPEMASAYGRVANFCGSLGVELMEPLSFKGRKGSGLPGGREAYADDSLRSKGGDFEKYQQTYRVWGRSLYNPDGDADGKRRWLNHQFGRSAEAVEGALAAAGKILPLVTTAHCPSAANNNYWPEMYFNMPTVDVTRRHPYSDTPSPKRFGTVSPLDPEFFLGLDEYADELLKGEHSGKYSPSWVAAQLDEAAEQTMTQLRRAKSKIGRPQDVDFRRLTIDATLQAGLGKFFAARFRSGVLYAIYLRTGESEALKQAIATNREARAAWAALAQAANGIYRDDVTFGPEYFQRGHWLDRLPGMDADIGDMEKLLAQPRDLSHVKGEPRMIARAMQAVFARDEPQEAPRAEIHTPAHSFRRGQPLAITCRVPHAGLGVHLRYRRVNQSETWQTIEMHNAKGEHRAVIAAEYTDSPFPLQYHFQIHTGLGGAWLYPGLHAGWQGQPYFVVRQGDGYSKSEARNPKPED